MLVVWSVARESVRRAPTEEMGEKEKKKKEEEKERK